MKKSERLLFFQPLDLINGTLNIEKLDQNTYKILFYK